MGVITFTDELTSPIPPSRIFKASTVDSQNLIPKLLAQAVKSIELIQGDGGNIGYLKHLIEELHEEKYTYKYTLIEGEGLMDKIEKICYDVKFEASAEDGTISKMTTRCYTKGNFELKEEEIKAGKAKDLGMYKVVEAYLLKNPDAYV